MEWNLLFNAGWIPANYREDRRPARNQFGDRRVVVVMHEQGWVGSRAARDTRLVVDEAGSWNDLHARYDVDRIDHGAAYSLPGGVYSKRGRGVLLPAAPG